MVTKIDIERNQIKGKYEGCYYPIPYKYSKYLFYSSFTMSLTSLIALYFDEGVTSFYYFVLFLTSINFWRKPEYGIRHRMDKTMVYVGLGYTFFVIYMLLNKEFYRIVFINMFLCVLIFDIISHTLCMVHSTKWIVFHMAIHIYASLMGLFIFCI